MELQNIGHEALHLPKRGRARLIQRFPPVFFVINRLPRKV